MSVQHDPANKRAIASHALSDVKDEAFSQWLDLFRWVAALLVLYAHLTNRFVTPLADVPAGERNIASLAAGFLSGFSHQAVMVFFVLSGYLVGGALVREVKKTNAINVPSYLTKRFIRLWTVLLPAFLLSFICFWISISVYEADKTGVFSAQLSQSGSPGTLLCNVFFMQTFACQQFAGNGPLWSLFNEFWYYIGFLALAAAAVYANTVGRIAIALAVCSFLLSCLSTSLMVRNLDLTS